MVELLLGHPQTDVNKGGADSGTTALHWAAYHGYAGIVRRLLAHPNVSADQAADNGATALHFATESGALEAMELLLERPEVDVNAVQNMTEPMHCTGCTSLMTAAVQEFTDGVEILLQRTGVDANIQDMEYLTTALGFASFLGNKGRIQYYLRTCIHQS